MIRLFALLGAAAMAREIWLYNRFWAMARLW
jgi:hypothetical protein